MTENRVEGDKRVWDLADLHLPLVIVMSKPVPDRVAQEFLKQFLALFSREKTLYTALREARQRLQPLENNFPCKTWLRIICQNPAPPPCSLRSLVNKASTLFKKTKALFNKPNTFFKKTKALFNKPNTFFNKAKTLFNKPNTFFNKAKTLFNKPNTFFNKAKTLFNKPKALFNKVNYFTVITELIIQFFGKDV
ncbi:hypothetical protein NIES2098_63180 [Calothrix sp. NIES-2098]|nr:hypothetical protein NIES2098_63180 [Calothrix sp. NIES-2098]